MCLGSRLGENRERTVSLHGAMLPFILFIRVLLTLPPSGRRAIRVELLRDRNYKAVTTVLHVSRGTIRIRVEIVRSPDTAM